MDCCPGEGLSADLSAITSYLKGRDPLMQEILNNTEWSSKHAVWYPLVLLLLNALRHIRLTSVCSEVTDVYTYLTKAVFGDVQFLLEAV